MHNVRLKAAALAGVAMLALAVPAGAQTTAPAPVRQSVDANGVDLFLGTVNVSSPGVSMGDGETGLSYYFLNTGGGWSDNVTAALDQDGSTVTVRLGSSTDRFTAAGTTYTSTEGQGATLTKAGGTYTYTGGDGTVAHFSSSTFAAAPYYASLGRATDIVSPSGKKLVYSYDSVYFCSASKDKGEFQLCTSHATLYRLSGITNSYGYSITYGYSGDGPEDQDDIYWSVNNGPRNWSTVASSGLVNLKNTSSPALSLTTGNGANTFTVTDPANRTTTYRQNTTATQVLGITRAGSSTENVTFTYGGGRVSTVTSAAGTWSYGAPSDTGPTRTVTVTDPSSQTTSYEFDIATQRMTRATDALGHVTSWEYDPSGRPTRTTAPEQNSVEYAYDARGNVTSTKVHAKPGSGQPDIETTATYDATCADAVTCNQPNTTTDALGHTTSYAYDPVHGGVTSVTLPAPTTGAVQPQVRTSYTAYTDHFGGTVYRATGTSTCRTAASCAGTADETVTSVSYGTLAANNLLPVSITTRAGDNSVSATSGVSYDAVGNVVSATGPLGAVSTFQYDADRWRTMAVGPDPDGAGPLNNRAQRLTHNDDGTVAVAEVGTATAAFGGFVSLQQVASSYDAAGRKVKDMATAGGAAYGVTQYSYDAVGRAVCAAVRMNPAAFGSLPGSACSLGTAGAAGPDRITRSVFDQVGRPASVTAAYGTADAAVETSVTYTDNGRTATATDAKGNKTSYAYDAYDRAYRTYYPSPTSAGASSATDYEELTYDGGSRVTGRQTRDGQTIGYGYDALGRMTVRDLPGVYWEDATYSYDLLGHLTYATDHNPHFHSFDYDALGRVTAQGSSVWSNTLQYDAAGRMTRQTWGDGLYVSYEHDATGAMTAIRENGTTALATFAYDDLGRRTSLTRGNGVVTSYGYDGASRLTSLGLDLAGTAQDQAYGFGYNPAGQITTRTAANDAYAWTGAVNVNRGYAANGLNQYTASGGVALGYDVRGNLTSSGSKTFGYDPLNRLIHNHAGQLYYRTPLGLLGQSPDTANADYVGQHLSAERGGGTTYRRYVWGPGADEPLVWYEGSGTGDRRWLVADERGSVVAVTDASGAATAINSYDEYGIPGAGNVGLFQYTGQMWLPGLELYDYKARMYSPTLGRFMQSDPIGYGDGMNMYAYTHNDPVNFTDPSGTIDHGSATVCVSDQCASDFATIGNAISDGLLRAELGVVVTGYSRTICERFPLSCMGQNAPRIGGTVTGLGAAQDAPLASASRDGSPQNGDLTCKGTATFSAVGPLPQAGGDSAFAPGTKPANGTVAIAGAQTFGFGRRALRQGAAAGISISPEGLDDVLRATGGPQPPYTVGDYGDVNIRNAPGSRFDIYRFSTMKGALAFGKRTVPVTITVPAGGHCPPGTSAQ